MAGDADERAMPGSTTAFVALHAAMAAAGRVAVCAHVRTKGAEARLVALQAAVEERDELGEQARAFNSPARVQALEPRSSETLD